MKAISRRNFLCAGAVGAASVMSGCVTSALFEEHRYSESVSSILISEDGKKLVVMTKEYHYIFDAPELLIKALRSPIHHSVVGSIGTLHIDGDGKASGDFRLAISKDADAGVRDQAVALGFTRASATTLPEYSGELKGMRYGSRGIEATDAIKLNREHTVYVVAEQSKLEKSGKLLLTPVTVAADGVLVIAAIPLFALVGMVVVMAHWPK